VLAIVLQRFQLLPPPADQPNKQKVLKFFITNILANGVHIGLRPLPDAKW
jgi:hypothetical protein